MILKLIVIFVVYIEYFKEKRISLKFLEGASIPNSVIKLELQQINAKPPDQAAIRKE